MQKKAIIKICSTLVQAFKDGKLGQTKMPEEVYS